MQVGARKRARPHHDKEQPTGSGNPDCQERSNRKHPEDEKVKMFSDLAYMGIEEVYPGATSVQPDKKPRKGKPAKKQKAQNRRISSKRVTVEHAIGRIKQYKRMRDPYDGTAEEFGREFQVTAGRTLPPSYTSCDAVSLACVAGHRRNILIRSITHKVYFSGSLV